jgi:hypothetical protein
VLIVFFAAVFLQAKAHARKPIVLSVAEVILIAFAFAIRSVARVLHGVFDVDYGVVAGQQSGVAADFGLHVLSIDERTMQEQSCKGRNILMIFIIVLI